ncbi:PQQ-like beta-propeller repeat protein [Verrucomicrobia bacterium]|nr:PQQ-like beta-propeller repeat protein [Verrucomicrobiota bacterium]
MRGLIINLVLFGLSFSCLAGDWPQLLGENRTGIYKGGLLPEWPSNGPNRLWKMKPGEGFAGPVVSGNTLVLFHRVGDEEVVEGMDARTGKSLLRVSYPTSYNDQFGFDNGPRAVPAIDGGQVFTLGAEGMVQCVDLKTGEIRWREDLEKSLNVSTGYFGLACSPLVSGNGVYLNVGGKGDAGIICLSRKEGNLLWKATDQEASYSSPAMATFGGKQRVLFFAREGLVGLGPTSGKVAFEFIWRANMSASVNGATPVIHDDHIFLTSSYATGAVLLKVDGDKVKKVWSGDESLSSQYATPIYQDGFLYGLHGRHDFAPGAVIRCVEFTTGKVRWSSPYIKPANLMLADGQLLILCETGQLIRAKATPDSFKETGRAQILGTTVRAYPALANGLFYARDKSQLVCIELGNN